MNLNSSRILRFPEVKLRTGLGRDSIYRLIREGKFPRQFKITERASGWLESEVEHFITNRAMQRTLTSFGAP